MHTAFDLQEQINQTATDKVVIAYKGPLTDVIMAELSRHIRMKLAHEPKICRKIFAIFIELAQNILFYSAEKVNFGYRNDRIGTLLVIQDDNYYYFMSSNKIENIYTHELLHNCKIINALDKEGLRRYKREQRSRPSKDRSKGAGIGLIQVAMISGYPLQMDFYEFDEDFSLYSLCVKVKKNKSEK